jgi:hypothetical protein
MFELGSGAETPCSEELRSGEPKIGGTVVPFMIMPQKIVLPRRPGEARLAPPQYYYPASRTGVMPVGYAHWIGRSVFQG